MAKKDKKYNEQIQEIMNEYFRELERKSILYTEPEACRNAEGIPLAIRGTCSKGHLVGIHKGCEGHAVIFGGTGSGKSTGPIMAALSTWKEPIVVIDPKGELYRRYCKLYEDGIVTIPSILFDPTRKDAARYDPLYLIKHDKANLMSNLTALAHAIAPVSSECREPYWAETIQAILKAGILHYMTSGFNFSEIMVYLMSHSLAEIVEEFRSDNDDRIKMIIGSIKNLKPEELASHDLGFRNKLEIFTEDMIKRAFDCKRRKNSKSFCWDDLRNHAIFLRIPEEYVEQWSAPIRLMITQLFKYLMRRPDKSVSGGEPPVLLLLDEIARFGKVEGLSDALCTLRSKNVNIVLALQSLAQLDKHYGVDERRIICENCQYKLILQAGDPETQEFLSKLIGVSRKKLHGKGATMDENGEVTGYSRQKNEAYLPRVFPHELATQNGAILLSPDGYERLEKIRVYDPDFEELLYSPLLTAKQDELLKMKGESI